MSPLPEALDRAIRIQAQACRQFNSAFSGGVLDRAADGTLGEMAPYFAHWLAAGTRETIQDAAPIRFIGALHHLTLTGDAAELAACYPAARADTDWPRFEAAARSALAQHRDRTIAFMASPPQTNEVRRCLALVGGYLTVAAETGLPLRCLEIGASAGLNVNWDRYAYVLGDAAWGDRQSPVLIDGDWQGPPPPLPSAIVVERAACDRSPVDITDEAAALRLQAYVWPDQPSRLQRLRAAISLAQASGVHLAKADARDWVAQHFAPKQGIATVLAHSVMWQYMPQDTRDAIQTHIEAAGARATRESPVAWLRMEPNLSASYADMELRLRLWPARDAGSEGDRLLAKVHPHGASVHWLA